MLPGKSAKLFMFLLLVLGTCDLAKSGELITEVASGTASNSCIRLFDMAGYSEEDPVFARMIYQQEMVKNGRSLEQGFAELFEGHPYARLVCLGETHGDPDQHLESIMVIKQARPKTNALFIEVNQKYNRLFKSYYDGLINAEDTMSIIQRDSQASHHITRNLLKLTKILGIQIVGVEKLDSATASFNSRFNLADRNQFTHEKIKLYMFNFDGISSSAPNFNRNNFDATSFPNLNFNRSDELEFFAMEGIYIGGAGHLYLRGTNFKSVSDLLADSGVPLIKVSSIRSDNMEWSFDRLVKDRGFVAPEVPRVFTHLPSGQGPIFLPALNVLPIIDAHETHWNEFDMYIIRP